MEIDFSYKFQPLFKLFDPNQFPEVDTIIMTGGRGSAKSYTVATFSLIGLVEYNWNVLYTRYTSLSITDSVKPEVSDKIELLGYEKRVIDTNTHIATNNARIAFKGVKTGSKQQTANLKSLSGFNVLVMEEAEEIPDLETFKKVFYSIRSTTHRNLNILILNPTTASHWIFNEFFEGRGVEGGFNGVHQNVMYIHTSYLDVNPKYIASNIRKDYERLKEDNPTDYDNIVLGGWITEPEGVLCPLSHMKFEDMDNISDDNVVFKFACGDPADKGGDHYSIPFMHVVAYENSIAVYVKDVIHSKDGIEAITERAVDKQRENFIEEVFLEVNGVGTGAYLLLKKNMLNHSRIAPLTATINKEVRILSHYEFVKKYFIFDKAYKSNPEYSLFINHVTQYSRDGDNKHKMDALDVLCTAASILKFKYKKILYG